MTRYWLSFDLGINGQYDELYSWLDKLEARECGDGVATFRSGHSRAHIIKELRKVVNLRKNPRIYLIDMHTGGKFIFGKRKLAPWTGYGQMSTDSGLEA